MKAIINGKRYDTEAPGTMTIAKASHGAYGDHAHIRETLHLTIRGTWYLAGCGGPASKYSHPAGQNCWSGGEKIIPLTADEALEWLEQEGETKEIERWFSRQLQDA